MENIKNIFYVKNIMAEKFKSFAFTIRPHSSENPSFVNEDLIQRVIKYLDKHDGGALAQECIDEPEDHHLHGQVFLAKEISLGDFTKSILSLVKTWAMKNYSNWTNSQNTVLRKGCKIAYNNSYIDDYLIKETLCDKSKEAYTYKKLPDNCLSYYPSAESQDRAKRKANAVDKQHQRWTEDFRISQFHDLYENEGSPLMKNVIIGKFFNHQFYISQRYQPIKDMRIFRQNILSFSKYFSQNSNSLDWMTKEEKELINKNDELRESLQHIQTFNVT